MKTLEELKKKWEENRGSIAAPNTYDRQSLDHISKSRTKKHMTMAMRYFWASFTLQVLVYALLSHVFIKQWGDTETQTFCLAGVLLFIPFTIMLMHKFKRMVLIRQDGTASSMEAYVRQQHDLLLSFYNFKKWYEILLVPTSSAIGVMLVFKLYVPGGAFMHPIGAVVTFAISVLSCIMAIHAENKKNFQQPLQGLKRILQEFSA
jgi:hypothetical protein